MLPCARRSQLRLRSRNPGTTAGTKGIGERSEQKEGISIGILWFPLSLTTLHDTATNYCSTNLSVYRCALDGHNLYNATIVVQAHPDSILIFKRNLARVSLSSLMVAVRHFVDPFLLPLKAVIQRGAASAEWSDIKEFSLYAVYTSLPQSLAANFHCSLVLRWLPFLLVKFKYSKLFEARTGRNLFRMRQRTLRTRKTSKNWSLRRYSLF
jgi:hypothetical protein